MSDNVQIKAFCDWQIFGDVEPKEFVTELLGPWMGKAEDDGRENHYLSELEVTVSSVKGPFGLRYVQFWVITPVTVPDLNYVMDVIKERLDQMVGDTDVRVLWVERV